MHRRGVAAAMRARAREVRHDGSFGGLFEITVWCSMRKVHVLLAFGVSILNVYDFCGRGLTPFTQRAVHKTVVVQVVKDKLMSADKPGVIGPEVNQFVIGRSDFSKQGLQTSDEATGAKAARYLPDGGAADSCRRCEGSFLAYPTHCVPRRLLNGLLCIF